MWQPHLLLHDLKLDFGRKSPEKNRPADRMDIRPTGMNNQL
jgi:hypothetical protein